MFPALPGAEPVSEELQIAFASALKKQGQGYKPRTRHLGTEGRAKYTNRLILESSPYLLQHAHNPVNWYPWGEEAFAEAREQGKPVLLSIGYATCHWCHVMEEESFENEEVAEILNQNYIAIKVDREVRPDVDSLYMASVHAFTGRGGWPMTVWLTADQRPFYGGTYFPRDDRVQGSHSAPGFKSLLLQLREVSQARADEVETVSQQVVAELQQNLAMEAGTSLPTEKVLIQATGAFMANFDATHGGLSQPMKFPSSPPVRSLLREFSRSGDQEALHMGLFTLDAMRRGGIYDHVGGGFHRYTTESTWTVPHFEKMLYDNALLVPAYLDAFQLTGDKKYAVVARDVLEYVAREMTSASGAFYAATDADSEGEEGLFFVWTPDEIREAVGEYLAELALLAYGVKAGGNFEKGSSVLRRDLSSEELAENLKRAPEVIEEELRQVRQLLRDVRSRRIPPLCDDKEIVAWNALMISAFAQGGLILREKAFVQQASAATDALLALAHSPAGLARYIVQGQAYGRGLLDDYAFFVAALLDLFEASSQVRWLRAARALQTQLDEEFLDEEHGGYYKTSLKGERLLVREKSLEDGAVPAGNSIAAQNLLRLHRWTDEKRYAEQAEQLFRAFEKPLQRFPHALGPMLDAVHRYLDAPKELIIVTTGEVEDAPPWVHEFAAVYVPNQIAMLVTENEARAMEEEIPLFKGKTAQGEQATAYFCEAYTCQAPVSSAEAFRKQLQARATSASSEGH